MARKIRLTKKRQAWAEPRQATLKGERLSPYSGAAASKYDAQLQRMVKAMRKEYNDEVRRLFKTHADEESALAMDASLASQARMLFNSLGKKWAQIFGSRAARITEQMIGHGEEFKPLELVEAKYAYADAMLAERAK